MLAKPIMAKSEHANMTIPTYVYELADRHGGWLAVPVAIYYSLIVQDAGEAALLAIIAGIPAVFLVLLSLPHDLRQLYDYD